MVARAKRVEIEWVMVVVAVLLMAGCASPAPAEPTATHAAVTSGPTPTSSATTTSETAPAPSSSAAVPDLPTAPFVAAEVDVSADPAPEGSLRFVGCAWRGVGQYRLDIEWEPVEDLPVNLSASFFIVVGDSGGPGAEGRIALPGRGSFSVGIDVRPIVSTGGDGELIASARGGLSVLGRRCALEVAPGLMQADLVAVPLVIDQAPPGLWPRGTVQELAASVDISDSDEPLHPLPSAVFSGVDLPVDRWYLAPERRLEYIRLSERGTCVKLQSVVEFDFDSVDVEQSRGCVSQPPSGSERSVIVEDPNWLVTVTGSSDDAAAAVAADLVGYPAAGVEPVTGRPDVGATEYFAGFIESNPDLEIVARLTWRDGELAIVRNATAAPEFGLTQTVFYGAEEWNAGRTGQPCLEHSYSVSRRDDEGYAWFVSADPTDVVVVPVDGGDSVIVELEPTTAGYGAAIIDIAEVPLDEVDRFPVFRSVEGETIPCTQLGDVNAEP